MARFTQRLITKTFSQRVVWIRAFFLTISATIIVRALHLQVIERPSLERQAESQMNHSVAVKLRRGPIYDAERNILAVSLPLDSIFAIPSEVTNPAKAADQISRILRFDRDSLYRKLSADISFVWLKRTVKPEISKKIHELNLDGIHYLQEYQRFYPMEKHAAQLIGFSGIDSQGLEGLEYQFNSHLMDNTGLSSIWNYLYRKPRLKTLSGGSLVLTIHSKLQHYTEKELQNAVWAMNAINGVAIIMKSRTGEILSMANIPDYDPNNFDRYEPSRYYNRAVAATYEPGSTFKIITVASALESKAIDVESIFFCEEGEYQIQDRVIHDVAEYGWLPLEKVIQKSSNICAAKIGQRIPKPVFYRMIREFGFGSKTGIPLPGESAGTVHEYQNWSETDVATMSFGHTISATPLQVITAINTIATGGVLIKPSIIRQAFKGNGQEIQQPQPQKKAILRKEVAESMKTFMVSVTQRGGTGYLARIPDVTVAGKTGTSRKFDFRSGQYSTTNHISSFIGFFPAEDPVLTILVIIDEPKEEYLGTKGAAPVFRKIAEHAIREYTGYFDRNEVIPTDRTETFTFNHRTPDAEDEERTYPQNYWQVAELLIGKTLREALVTAEREKLDVEVSGTGIVRKVRTIDSEARKYLIELN